jgi:hypothetical protein
MLGGYVSTGSLRASKANNKYMGEEYKSNEESSYLLYIDRYTFCHFRYTLIEYILKIYFIAIVIISMGGQCRAIFPLVALSG